MSPVYINDGLAHSRNPFQWENNHDLRLLCAAVHSSPCYLLCSGLNTPEASAEANLGVVSASEKLVMAAGKFKSSVGYE